MNSKFKINKIVYPFIGLLLVIAVTLVSYLQQTPISAYASMQSTGVFSPRSRGVDLMGDNFSVTNTPAITVLTHGLGGKASYWSNNNDNIAADDTFGFAYDDRSLIERLRQVNGANVFWAKMEPDGTSFYLHRIPVMRSRYQQYKIDNLETVFQFTLSEINQHIIIVFEATETGREGAHLTAYNEFRIMLNAVVNDYGYVTGGVYPKINLIGHSRGGLTNMEYANNHPRLISDIYSMGTPYNGSNFGRVNLFADMVVHHIDSTPGTALYDINDTATQNRLRNDWAANRQNGRGSHIRLFPMAGTSTLGQIADLGGAWGSLGTSLVVLVPASFAIFVTMASSLVWDLETLKGIPNTSWIVINDAFYSAFSGWAWLWVGRNTHIDDDLLVHKDSQSATGYTGITDTFHKRFNHIGSGSGLTVNFDSSRVSEQNFAVVHNLESRDDDFIDWIVDRINTNFNIFYTNTYENGLYIRGFSNTFITNLIIPETLFINGVERAVVTIGNNAFANQSQITQISIPASVTIISSFAFQRCTGLTNINIPNGVTSIANYAFAGCTSLKTVTIPASVTYISYGAFAGCSALENIAVHSANSYYRSDGYCLIEIATNNPIACWNDGTTYIPTFMLYIENHYFDNSGVFVYLFIDEIEYFYYFTSLYASFNDEVNVYLIDAFDQYCYMTGYSYGGAELVGFTVEGQLTDWYLVIPAEGTSIIIPIQPYFG